MSEHEELFTENNINNRWVHHRSPLYKPLRRSSNSNNSDDEGEPDNVFQEHLSKETLVADFETV